MGTRCEGFEGGSGVDVDLEFRLNFFLDWEDSEIMNFRIFINVDCHQILRNFCEKCRIVDIENRIKSLLSNFHSQLLTKSQTIELFITVAPRRYKDRYLGR